MSRLGKKVTRPRRLKQIKAGHARPRRTEILSDDAVLRDEDVIENARSAVLVSRNSYIKRTPLVEFAAQYARPARFDDDDGRRDPHSFSETQDELRDLLKDLFLVCVACVCVCVCHKMGLARVGRAAAAAEARAFGRVFHTHTKGERMRESLIKSLSPQRHVPCV